VNQTRRLFVRVLGSGVMGISMGSFILTGAAEAADTPKLSPDDPAAKSLQYTHASIDTVKRCAGCQFYTGAASDEWGPCVIFPDKLVNSQGLCNSWYAKA
jgi:hypothetical protein